MTKKATETKATETKAPFAWDSEKLVCTSEISEYEKREVRVCSLKGKEYVVFTTVKKIKDVWKPVGGYSVPKSIWTDIVEAVHDDKLAGAFFNMPGMVVELNVTEEPKKAKTRKTSTKKGADK